jgi:hypothetical protein
VLVIQSVLQVAFSFEVFFTQAHTLRHLLKIIW